MFAGRWFNAYDLSLVNERIRRPVGSAGRGVDADVSVVEGLVGWLMSNLSIRLQYREHFDYRV